MPVYYNGVSLEPIQSVNVTQQTQFADVSGKLKTYSFEISIKGKIVPPSSLSDSAKFNYILAESAAILGAFKKTGNKEDLDLNISPLDGACVFTAQQTRVKSVTIDEGNWVNYADYTISVEADKFDYGGYTVPPSDEDQFDLDDSWSVELNDEDDRFTKTVHRISAKAKDKDKTKGWQIAKPKVDAKINALIPSSITSASGGSFSNPHNKKISYRINYESGEVSAEVTISYHKTKGSPSNNYATHDQTITERQSSESARGFIDISGTINGLAALGSTNRYNAANALWAAVKAEIEGDYSTLTILSTSETHDTEKGTISYSYEIEDYPRPTDGSKSRRLSIVEMGPLAAPPDLYVIHQTITGGTGPLFQGIGTKKVHTKTVTIELITKSSTIPNTLEYKPPNSLIDSDNIQQTLHTGKISRTTTFIWVP